MPRTQPEVNQIAFYSNRLNYFPAVFPSVVLISHADFKPCSCSHGAVRRPAASHYDNRRNGKLRGSAAILAAVVCILLTTFEQAPRSAILSETGLLRQTASADRRKILKGTFESGDTPNSRCPFAVIVSAAQALRSEVESISQLPCDFRKNS